MINNMEKVAPFAPVPNWVQNYIEEHLMTESALYEWVNQYIKPKPVEIPSENEIKDLPEIGQHPFIQFILSWSASIEVLEPEWLRTVLADFLKKT